MAIIGGTGFSDAVLGGVSEVVSTPYGPCDLSKCTAVDGSYFYFLPRHGIGHSTAPHLINHHANIAALVQYGVTHVLSTAAVGSLRKVYTPGSFVVLNDLIDLSRGPVTTFFNEPGSVTHTDFTHPFDEDLRQQLIASLSGNKRLQFHTNGTYVSVSGPRYETPAEVAMFAAFGGDVVGMTVAAEAILSKEAGLKYACLGVITNYGTGINDGVLSHCDVVTQMQDAFPAVQTLLLELAQILSGAIVTANSRVTGH